MNATSGHPGPHLAGRRHLADLVDPRPRRRPRPDLGVRRRRNPNPRQRHPPADLAGLRRTALRCLSGREPVIGPGGHPAARRRVGAGGRDPDHPRASAATGAGRRSATNTRAGLHHRPRGAATPGLRRGLRRRGLPHRRRHDTRAEAKSLEDALVRDADRLWRFDHAGIALAAGWFRMDPAVYTDRLATEIVPELLTQAGIAMATADLERSRALLKTAVLR